MRRESPHSQFPFPCGAQEAFPDPSNRSVRRWLCGASFFSGQDFIFQLKSVEGN